MKLGDKIGIVCCSNGQSESYKPKIKELIKTIENMGLQVVLSPYIYEVDYVYSGTAAERAEALMDMYKNTEIKAIFDISGGDIANEILEYLDYEIIKNSNKRFYGYSDLTTVINAIYTKTGNVSGLYQIRNLIYDDKENQVRKFRNTLMNDDLEISIQNREVAEKENSDNEKSCNEKLCNEKSCNEKPGNENTDDENSRHVKPDNDERKPATDKYLTDLDYYFIQENYMKGVVIGGNIRCLLKLAGTEYWPDFQDKILLLEALNSSAAQVITFLSQLRQLGVFHKINGILLGTFTKLDAEIYVPSIEELIQRYCGKDIPIARATNIGHGFDAGCIYIGEMLELNSN